MSKVNNQRKSCKDVFNSYLVSTASYSGIYEFPRIKPTQNIPNRLISFSKSIANKDNNQWIHFFEDDYLFERTWRAPHKYLDTFKRYNGIILPDFSLYRDMPLSMQIWNIYRSRAIGNWLQKNGVEVIPNIRFGDKRTYDISCDGIEKHCTIAVGSYGNMKNIEDRKIFLAGLDYIIKKLKPSNLVIYGSLSDEIIAKYSNTNIVKFNCEYATSHKEGC